MVKEWHRGEYRISTERSGLDLAVIHNFLSGSSYWARDRPLEKIKRSIENSLPFGLYRGQAQVGFARVVTDYTTFAWVADVFILKQFRGQGLGKWLMEVVVGHPDLQGLRRWALVTRDAHGLYASVGFGELKTSALWMERSDAE